MQNLVRLTLMGILGLLVGGCDNSDTSSSSPQSLSEVVNDRPAVVSSITPIAGFTPLTVAFAAASGTDSEVSLVFEWDFGDGSVSSEPITTHTYALGGNFTAVLTVTGSDGTRYRSTTIITTTRVNNAPIAAVSVTPDSAPWIVRFDAGLSSDIDGSIVSYTWSFGDGQTAVTTGPVTTHEYQTLGDYLLSLSVEDNEGGAGNTTLPVNVPTDSAAATAAVVLLLL